MLGRGLCPELQTMDLRSNRCYYSHRVGIAGAKLVIQSRNLLDKLLDLGDAPVTPLQSNVYSLGAEGLLRFDESDPVATDGISTIRFLYETNGKTVVVPEPFMAWRLHPGRFHASQDILEFKSGNLRCLQEAQKLVGPKVNWSRAKAHATVSLLQNVVRFEPWHRWPSLVLRCTRMYRSKPGRISPWWVFRIVFRKLVFHESPMQIDR